MKSQLIQSAITVVLMTIASGCATQKTWVYRSGSYSTRPSATMAKSVVVLPFDDTRENLNKNRIGFYAIPLAPGFGWADYSAPEGAQMHVTSGLWINYKPTEDFSKALAQELTASGLFREAFFDYKKGAADMIIRGRILNTDYRGTLISYGLGPIGPDLWILGFPAGTVRNELSVELSCMDSQTGNLLFSKTYTAQPYSKVFWIYSMPNDFNYAEMLAQVYKEFAADLVQVLSSKTNL